MSLLGWRRQFWWNTAIRVGMANSFLSCCSTMSWWVITHWLMSYKLTEMNKSARSKKYFLHFFYYIGKFDQLQTDEIRNHEKTYRSKLHLNLILYALVTFLAKRMFCKHFMTIEKGTLKESSRHPKKKAHAEWPILQKTRAGNEPRIC